MPRYKTNARFWYIGKRNKNNELIGLILVLGIISFGAWDSLPSQSQGLVAVLVILVILLVGLAVFCFYTITQAHQHQKFRALSIAKVDAMDGHDFEHYIAELLRHQGYSRVEVTRASGDYGADIIAHKDHEKWAIQTKCFTKTVGNRAINEVVGSNGLQITQIKLRMAWGNNLPLVFAQ